MSVQLKSSAREGRAMEEDIVEVAAQSASGTADVMGAGLQLRLGSIGMDSAEVPNVKVSLKQLLLLLLLDSVVPNWVCTTDEGVVDMGVGNSGVVDDAPAGVVVELSLEAIQVSEMKAVGRASEGPL